LRLWVANLTYRGFYLSDEFFIKTKFKKTMKTTATMMMMMMIIVVIIIIID